MSDRRKQIGEEAKKYGLGWNPMNHACLVAGFIAGAEFADASRQKLTEKDRLKFEKICLKSWEEWLASDAQFIVNLVERLK